MGVWGRGERYLMFGLIQTLVQIEFSVSTRRKRYNSMNKNNLGLMALSAIALAGCSEAVVRPQSSCELMTSQICSSAAEAQLHDGALKASYAFRRSSLSA